MKSIPIKGRGSISNRTPRFEQLQRETFQDDWSASGTLEEARLATTVTPQTAKSIISRNDSPDIHFEQTINPYRGCEHGCIYCYARPTHAYLNLSPGLDFETKLYAKSNAADLLRKELSKPGYVARTIALGANTDPYQPIEQHWRITASLLQVLEEFNHPVTIVTKSASVTRDAQLLSRMASKNLVRVYMSIGTLDPTIARTLEPRASTPVSRLAALRKLSSHGVPTGVLVAPVIPALTDHDLEKILFSCKDVGVEEAAYVLLRLPLEVAELFQEWLETHHPLKKAHVLNLLRGMHNGKLYDSSYQTRMKGTGVFAQLLEQRFKHACAKAGLNQSRQPLDTTQFLRPIVPASQLSLF